jgi:hypothetical protein
VVAQVQLLFNLEIIINMAHYAFLDENNVVVEVIVGKDESEEQDWEQLYSQARGLRCKRTSYNTLCGTHSNGGVPFRYTYAGIGYLYIDEIDAFIAPSPFPSWIIDIENKTWKPPVPEPTDGKMYDWDEANLRWIEVIEPVIEEE